MTKSVLTKTTVSSSFAYGAGDMLVEVERIDNSPRSMLAKITYTGKSYVNTAEEIKILACGNEKKLNDILSGLELVVTTVRTLLNEGKNEAKNS